MLPGQGMQHRIVNTEIDDNDDTRRRMFQSAKANSAICEGERIFVKNPPHPLTTAIQMWYLCSVRKEKTVNRW